MVKAETLTGYEKHKFQKIKTVSVAQEDHRFYGYRSLNLRRSFVNLLKETLQYVSGRLCCQQQLLPAAV